MNYMKSGRREKRNLIRLAIMGLGFAGFLMPLTGWAERPSTENDWQKVSIDNVIGEEGEGFDKKLVSTSDPIVKAYADGTTFGMTGKNDTMMHINSSTAWNVKAYKEGNFVFKSDGTIRFISQHEENPSVMEDVISLMEIYESHTDGGTHVTFDADVDINLEAPHGTNGYDFYGIELYAQGQGSVTDLTTEKNFDLKMTDTKDSANRKNMIGLYLFSGDSVRADDTHVSVTARDTVTIDLSSNQNSNLYGIYVYNEEAKGGKTELSFEQDASVKTVSEKGMATALLLQNEYSDSFVKNAKGTTLHLSAKGEQATYGIHEYLNKGKTSINAEGNVVIEASSSARTSTGWRRKFTAPDKETGAGGSDGSARSDHHIGENLDITASSKANNAYGMAGYFNKASGSFIVEGNTTIHVTAPSANTAYGLYDYTYSTDMESTYHFKHLTITGDENSSNHAPISLFAYNGGRNVLTVDEGTDIKFFTGNNATVFARTNNHEKSSAIITLNGENRLVSDGMVANAKGQNAVISINKGNASKQTLQGMAIAQSGGKIDISLNTKDTQDVFLYTENYGTIPQVSGIVDMEVKNGATWNALSYKNNLRHTSRVTNLSMGNKGRVDVRQFAAETDMETYHTMPSLTIEHLKGTDGIFTIQSNIDKDKAQYIQITKSSEGTHHLDVKDTGGARVDPAKPILVVLQEGEERADSGMARMARAVSENADSYAFDADFKILTPVDVGPFTYIIGSRNEVVNAGLRGDELTDDNPNNFYLYTDGKDHQEPEPTPDPAPNPKPALNPSAKGSLVRSDADFLFGLAEMQTLRQRLGDIRHFPEEDWDPWAKVIRTKYEGNDHDSSVKSTISGVQFGAQKNISRKDGKAQVGLYGSYLDSKNTYDGGRYDGKYYGIGLYGSLEEGNTYYDLVLRMGRSKGDLKTMTSGGESVTAKGHGRNQWGISLETGKRYQWEDGQLKKAARHGTEYDGFFIEPQAQLAYTRFGSFDMKTTGDLASHQDGYGILLGRIGPQVEYVKHYDSQRALSLYGKVMMNHIFNGKPSILYNGTNRIEQDFRDSYVTYGAGVNYTVKDRYEIYGEWERSCGGDWEEKYRFDLGVKYHF